MVAAQSENKTTKLVSARLCQRSAGYNKHDFTYEILKNRQSPLKMLE